jgi:hypothetical protein
MEFSCPQHPLYEGRWNGLDLGYNFRDFIEIRKPHFMKKSQQNPPHSVPFTTGKIVLHSPCHVGKEAFTQLEGGNKFCSQCQKKVHDMTRLSETEVKALFEANNGNVCGSIRVRVPKVVAELEPEVRPMIRFRKPLFLKQWAAAASFLLLYQTSDAKPVSKPLITWQDHRAPKGTDGEVTSKTNTLVTGVILNQDSMEVPLDIPVSIYANSKLVAEVTSRHGLFSYEFSGQLNPDDVIGIVIKKHQAGKDEPEGSSYGGGKLVTRLGDAQNIKLVIQYDFPFEDIQVDGGISWDEYKEGR